MKYQTHITALVATTSIASAGPITKRAPAVTDVEILNYVLTIEHLENRFYLEGLANYTQDDFIAAGFADPFYANLHEISCDEQVHVSFLTSTLGSLAAEECVYNFPVDTPDAFVVWASVLKGISVSAYLGAAVYIADKSYLADAGSILTVESRHSSYIRASLGKSPFAQPFDNPLTFNEVYSLAISLIVSCPVTNPPLPISINFPALILATSGPIKSGNTITLVTPGYTLQAADGVTPIYAAFITVFGPIWGSVVVITGGFEIVVPKGINGQSYVVLTSCTDSIDEESICAGPAIVEITNDLSY